MKTMIVFESMFGNTEHFAEECAGECAGECAEGLTEAGAETLLGGALIASAAIRHFRTGTVST